MQEKDKYNSKASLIPIYILMILKEKSSKKNPLSRKKITDALISEFNLDTLSQDDRRTIPRCVRTLMKHFEGAIIENTPPRGGFATWYLDSQKMPAFGGEILSAEETNLFIDMIASSKIISDEYTHSMIHKVTSLLADEDKKKLNKNSDSQFQFNYKCENKQLIDTKNTIEKAMRDYREIRFGYPINGKTYPIDAFPHTIVEENDEVCLKAIWRNNKVKFNLRDMSEVRVGSETEKLYNIDPDKKFTNSSSLETLLTNIRIINKAIEGSSTIKFKYLNYIVKNNSISLEPSKEEKEVFPSSTAYKNGKHYLIAYDTNNYCPVFFRTDLMTDIQMGENLDFWERKKFDFKEAHELLDRHPYMLPGFSKMTARFLINEKSLDRVIDTFGNKAVVEKIVTPIDTLSEGNLKKLADAFKEDILESFTGYKQEDSLVQVTVKTDEEELLHFALENADVVEIITPEFLRLRVLEISETISRRYSKTNFDFEQINYNKILRGEKHLRIGSTNEFDTKLLKLITRRNEYGKVKKIEIVGSVAYEELIKFDCAEEVVINGTELTDFTFLRNLPALRNLTLMNTSIESADILTNLPPLESLFIHRNYKLEDYDFLKNMEIKYLYIGRNGSDDLSVLYELDNVAGLVIEEGVLETMDVKKLMALKNRDGHHIMVHRWIELSTSLELPRIFRINYRMLRDV